MNPVKKKLADFLTELAKKELDAMDADNPCARALKGLDTDALLEKSIQRITYELSTLEAGRILSSSVKLRLSGTEDVDKHKKEIKLIASKVAKRVESKYGGLDLPPECQDLLMNLL